MAAYMTLDQRKQIETCLKLDLNTQDIADVIGMSERTVRREIKRGTIMLYDTELKEYPCYCPDYAQNLADEASKRKVVNASWLMIQISLNTLRTRLLTNAGHRMSPWDVPVLREKSSKPPSVQQRSITTLKKAVFRV